MLGTAESTMTPPAPRADRTRRRAYVLAIVVTAIEVVLDLLTWVELDIATIYGIPLVLVAFTRDRRLLWTLTVALTLTTFLAYTLQVPVGTFDLREPLFINRVLDTVALLIIASLLHLWMTSLDIREAQARLLETQYRRLEAVNIALVDRDAQIVRQNGELVRRRLEADQASARKTRLLNAVAHDVRNPLHAINLTAEAIRRAVEDPALGTQIPQMTRRLQASVLSTAALVSDVLDIAYVDSGLAQRRDSTFSLDEVIEAACRDFAPMAEVKRLHLKAQASDVDIRVYTDRIKLHRIVSNVVANAIKFTVEGGVILQAAHAVDGAATIGIRDTGVGIPENQLEHIFDEFARLSAPTEDGECGWGLGLAICRRLADIIGARIDVESEVNAGTLFTVRLPPERVVAITPRRPSAGPSKTDGTADPANALRSEEIAS